MATKSKIGFVVKDYADYFGFTYMLSNDMPKVADEIFGKSKMYKIKLTQMKTKRSPKKLVLGNYESLFVYEKKDENKMVSLNPKYKIEICTLSQLAEKVKDDNPELYNILTILIASLLGNDESKLLIYCNKYLEDRAYADKLKDQISDMLKNYKKDDLSDDDKNWYF